jgi:hypothetical protein
MCRMNIYYFDRARLRFRQQSGIHIDYPGAWLSDFVRLRVGRQDVFSRLKVVANQVIARFWRYASLTPTPASYRPLEYLVSSVIGGVGMSNARWGRDLKSSRI